jgi:hypothetical protein
MLARLSAPGRSCCARLRGASPPRRAAAPVRPARAAATTAAAAAAAAMDADVEECVERIHASPMQLVLFVTGGAAAAPAWLLGVPGASRTVIEARVPYARAALADALGGAAPPAGTPACSPAMAAALAKAAYRRAAALSPFGTPVVGVGASCALATDRDRRGAHAVHVATHAGLATRAYGLALNKGVRGRAAEDALASRLVVRAAADAAGVARPAAGGGAEVALPLDAADALSSSYDPGDPASLLPDLLAGRLRCVEFGAGGAAVAVDAPRPGRLYLPGSFNPLHDGHRALLAAAAAATGREPAFELSLANADKGAAPLAEAARRLAQFAAAAGGATPVVATRAPLFTQKADLLPGSVFVVGFDTAARLVQPRYYGSPEAMAAQFAALALRGCSFLVAGRRDAASGRFLTLRDLEVPEALRHGSGDGAPLFAELPEEAFRADVSSTELRAAAAAAGGAAAAR